MLAIADKDAEGDDDGELTQATLAKQLTIINKWSMKLGRYKVDIKRSSLSKPLRQECAALAAEAERLRKRIMKTKNSSKEATPKHIKTIKKTVENFANRALEMVPKVKPFLEK